MKVLVPDTAGVIGYHIGWCPIERSVEVIGFDNLKDYYDVNPKKISLARSMEHPGYAHVADDVGCTPFDPVKDGDDSAFAGAGRASPGDRRNV